MNRDGLADRAAAESNERKSEQRYRNRIRQKARIIVHTITKLCINSAVGEIDGDKEKQREIDG